MALRRISATLSPAKNLWCSSSHESPYNSRLHRGEISSLSAIRTSSSPFYAKLSLTGLVASRRSPPYTAISPIASGNGNQEEKDSEMKKFEYTNGSGLQGLQGSSFVAEAAVGKVECTSRGCRPIFDDNTEDTHQKRNSSVKLMWSENNTMCPEMGADFVSNALADDCCSVKQAFEAALQVSPCDAHLLSTYAGFVWKAMGDLSAAEELYSKALGGLPCDTNLLASHAHFLWQTEQ